MGIYLLSIFDFPDIFPADSSTAQLFEFTDCDCNADVFFYKLINGGHTWPGVFIAGQAAVLGNTNRDLNASDELWDFFSSYTLCDEMVSVGENRFESHFSVYPNPASTEVNVVFPIGLETKITISDMRGQLLISEINQNRIDISSLAKGLYFLKIEEGQKVLIKKIIKN
ncbi:MAG: T9SS type A sorting domain-containing protein [Bacteroidota bacterium]